MRGEPWRMALQMAAALVVALSYVEGARIVVSSRSTLQINCTDSPYNLVMYDSKIDTVSHIRKWWHKLRVVGNTPEGLVFDALMNQILKDAQGTDAFFINLSDGCPSCEAVSWNKVITSGNTSCYDGMSALEHTRKMVDNMVKNNITVISYYVSKTLTTHHESFEKMYGKYAHFILVTDMMMLARTLNKRFIQRNKVSK
jgi:hypothetical protein